jgi:hypothetical protein
MEFDQIFEGKKQHRFNYQGFNNRYNGYSNRPDYGYDKYFRQKALLKQIISNPKLRIVIITGFLIFVGIIVALIALLFPLLMSLVNFVLENGISGLLGEAGNLIEKLWNGNK